MLHENGAIRALLNFRSLLLMSFSLTAFFLFKSPISVYISSGVAREKKKKFRRLGNREWVDLLNLIFLPMFFPTVANNVLSLNHYRLSVSMLLTVEPFSVLSVRNENQSLDVVLPFFVFKFFMKSTRSF